VTTTTIDRAVKGLALDRLLDAHPNLVDAAHLLADAEAHTVDTATVAPPGGAHAARRRLRPFRRAALQLGAGGHALAAGQTALRSRADPPPTGVPWPRIRRSPASLSRRRGP
jgi:hypothetical protein